MLLLVLEEVVEEAATVVSVRRELLDAVLVRREGLGWIASNANMPLLISRVIAPLQPCLVPPVSVVVLSRGILRRYTYTPFKNVIYD